MQFGPSRHAHYKHARRCAASFRKTIAAVKGVETGAVEGVKTSLSKEVETGPSKGVETSLSKGLETGSTGMDYGAS